MISPNHWYRLYLGTSSLFVWDFQHTNFARRSSITSLACRRRSSASVVQLPGHTSCSSIFIAHQKPRKEPASEREISSSHSEGFARPRLRSRVKVFQALREFSQFSFSLSSFWHIANHFSERCKCLTRAQATFNVQTKFANN